MKKEPVEFQVDGLTLRGKIYWPDEPKPLAVLFLHGWTGLPQDTGAPVLAENGFTCMTFSLSGHGKSDGRLEDQTRAESLKEVLAAYDFFKSRLPAGTRIAAAGNSYGGYFAAMLCTDRPLAAIQMRVPANYPDERFTEQQLGQSGETPQVFQWRLKPQASDATKSLRGLHAFGGPVQIIEAGNDDVVPHQTVQNYVDAIPDKSKLDYHPMKGWPHSLGEDAGRNRQYQRLTLDWLNSQA